MWRFTSQHMKRIGHLVFSFCRNKKHFKACNDEALSLLRLNNRKIVDLSYHAKKNTCHNLALRKLRLTTKILLWSFYRKSQLGHVSTHIIYAVFCSVSFLCSKHKSVSQNPEFWGGRKNAGKRGKRWHIQGSAFAEWNCYWSTCLCLFAGTVPICSAAALVISSLSPLKFLKALTASLIPLNIAPPTVSGCSYIMSRKIRRPSRVLRLLGMKDYAVSKWISVFQDTIFFEWIKTLWDS